MTAITSPRAPAANKTRRIGLDGWVWIAVIALTPVQQLIFVLSTPQVRLLPVVAGLASLLLARVAKPAIQGVLVTVAVLIMLAGLISGTNSSITESFVVAASFAVMLAVVPAALLFQIKHYPGFTRAAVTVVLLVQTASATAGIIQLAGIPVLGVVAREGRVNGLAYHPNVLGVMSVLAILVLLDALRRRSAPRVVLLLALGLNAVALISTASLSSLITLTVGLLFFVVRLTRHARWVSVIIAGTVIAIALLATGGNLEALLPDTFSDRVDQVTGASGSGDVASLLIRFATYEHALNYISSDPLVGVGMDPLNQGTLTPSLVVHNYILRGWYQGGLLLVIGFIILTVALILVAVRGMRNTPLTAPSAIIASMLAFGATSAFYTQSNYWLPILFAVAVVSSVLPGVQKRATRR